MRMAANGPVRAARTLRKVGADGNFVRYQGSAYDGMQSEWVCEEHINLGGIAEV